MNSYTSKRLSEVTLEPNAYWLVVNTAKSEQIFTAAGFEIIRIDSNDTTKYRRVHSLLTYPTTSVIRWIQEIKIPVFPPTNRFWHIDVLDFPWSELTSGERPLLLGECCEQGDLVLVNGQWSDGVDIGAQMTEQHLPTKTKRPLPL